MKKKTAPRVFISYAHDSEPHKESVRLLADKLVSKGIDAHIDRYYESGPVRWPQWMQDQIRKAQFVLVVASPLYKKRFEGREKKGRGAGAKWEGAIITQLLYSAGGRADKFIPIVFTRADEKLIPSLLGGHTRYLVDNEDGFERLLRRLTDQPEIIRPPLGTIPHLPSTPSSATITSRPPTASPSTLPSANAVLISRNSDRARTLLRNIKDAEITDALLEKKLALLDESERLHIRQSLTKSVLNENALSALATIAKTVGDDEASDIVSRALNEVLFTNDIATKARFMRAFPPELLERVDAAARNAFFAEVIEIMNRDQYVEVNIVTPAVVKVHRAIPDESTRDYMSALFNQCHSQAFEGQPAAESALDNLPVRLVRAGLEQITQSDLFSGRAYLKRFIKRNRAEWPDKKTALFDDFISLKSPEFVHKYWSDL